MVERRLVAVYRTPGGQRRYHRDDLDRFMSHARSLARRPRSAEARPRFGHRNPRLADHLRKPHLPRKAPMQGRPSRAVIAAEWLALASAVAAGALLAGDANWDAALFAILLVSAVASDLRAVRITANKIVVSGSFLVIITAIAILGAAPAALIAVVTTLSSWASSRYPLNDLLVMSPFTPRSRCSAASASSTRSNFGIRPTRDDLLPPRLALFVTALTINFVTITAYTRHVEVSSFRSRIKTFFLPVLPSELDAALLRLGITFAYEQLVLPAVALFAIVLLIFQYLVGELILSQDRAVQLEQRAKQLAGFQVALLGALLRTLDLRDR